MNWDILYVHCLVLPGIAIWKPEMMYKQKYMYDAVCYGQNWHCVSIGFLFHSYAWYICSWNQQPVEIRGTVGNMFTYDGKVAHIRDFLTDGDVATSIFLFLLELKHIFNTAAAILYFLYFCCHLFSWSSEVFWKKIYNFALLYKESFTNLDQRLSLWEVFSLFSYHSEGVPLSVTFTAFV